MNLPNFLVIGAPRCGTTWLHDIISTHPAVYVPPYRKEVHFFDRHWEKGVEWYKGFFSNAGSSVAVGETTPTYLVHKDSPRRIAATIPECRLLMILRDPVQRAYSHYGHMMMVRGMDISFEEVLDQNPGLLQVGMYSTYIRRYRTLFDSDQMLILVFERAVEDVRETFQRVGSFLGLPQKEFELDRNPRNQTRVPRCRLGFSTARKFGDTLRGWGFDWVVEGAKDLGIRRLFGADERPPMDGRMKERLTEIYGPEVERMEVILGGSLPEWR